MDFGVIAWHEDDRWNVAKIQDCLDLEAIMARLKSQPTNGGAIALISYDEDFFVVIRALGSHIRMMISDATYALDSDLAAEIVEILDLDFPEEDDDSEPGGSIDLLADLGMSAMEMETLCEDLDLFPDEQLDAIASRLGFGDIYRNLADRE